MPEQLTDKHGCNNDDGGGVFCYVGGEEMRRWRTNRRNLKDLTVKSGEGIRIMLIFAPNLCMVGSYVGQDILGT